MREERVVSYSVMKSPVGELMLAADEEALIGIYFADCNHAPAASAAWNSNPKHTLLRQAEFELIEYFAAIRKKFSLPLRLTGTEFQKRIWREISLIPYGQTITYSELASRAGSPRAIRAAGSSTGQNPISIIIPCHRVMGKNGAMCGFAGGLPRKQHLLELENPAAKFTMIKKGWVTGDLNAGMRNDALPASTQQLTLI